MEAGRSTCQRHSRGARNRRPPPRRDPTAATLRDCEWSGASRTPLHPPLKTPVLLFDATADRPRFITTPSDGRSALATNHRAETLSGGHHGLRTGMQVASVTAGY